MDSKLIASFKPNSGNSIKKFEFRTSSDDEDYDALWINIMVRDEHME